MVKLTLIARGLDDGRDHQDELYKQQAKSIFKNLSKGQNEPSRMSIETGPYVFHHTQRNIGKLNDELYEVQQIMTRNVQEVLGVGEKLDQVSELSNRLTSEYRIYADKAKDLNRQCLNDGTPEVRDAAFSALAAVAKLVSMRPLERSLEKLDDVRKKKLSEMISGSEGGPTDVGSVTVQSSSGNTSLAETSNGSFTRRSPASMLSGKKPIQAAVSFFHRHPHA